MCREAIALTPAEQSIQYLITKAEALPIATGQAGLITAAQAAHWFDRPRFYAEAERALRPAGVVAPMANHREWKGSAFLGRYESFLEEHSPGYQRDFRIIDFGAELAALPWVGATCGHRHRWSRRLTPDALIGLLR
jgi:SAM-dependent methyltransferase